MKRLAIYSFKDKDGIVDDYVYEYLKELRKIASTVCIVVNCKILDKYLAKLNLLCDEIYYVDGNTPDMSMYRIAISKVENFREYDELILSNNSFYGPIYPLQELFDTVQKSKPSLDFWGVTEASLEAKRNNKKLNNYVYVEDYFVVFKKKIIVSDFFEKFFAIIDEMHNLNKSLDEINALHEIELTKQVCQFGYKYGSLVGIENFEKIRIKEVYPYYLIKELESPFVSKEIFAIDEYKNNSVSRGNQAKRLLNSLSENSMYDINLICQNLCRTQTMSSIRDNLQLNYFLSSKYTKQINSTIEKALDSSVPKSIRVALIVYIYYEDAVLDCLNYANNLNGIADLYIVTSREDTLLVCKKYAEELELNNTTFVLKENKGRDISSFLIDCRYVFDKYEYVCYFHDKKSPHLNNKYETQDFFEHCMESILPSKEYAQNVIDLLDSKPYLGLLVPPPLNWGIFYASEYKMHQGCYNYIKQLIAELNLNVPFDDNPVAPYGTMFWIRSKAIQPLFNKNWTYEDMPCEPIPPDGTILHAIERLIPFVVQSSNELCAWIIDENSGETYLGNCYASLKSLNKDLFKIFPCGRLADVQQFIKDPQNDRYHEALTLSNYMYHNKMKIKYSILNLITFGLVNKFKKRLMLIDEHIEKFKKYDALIK